MATKIVTTIMINGINNNETLCFNFKRKSFLNYTYIINKSLVNKNNA